MIHTIRIIEIGGYLSDEEIGKGKTALWFSGEVVVELNFSPENYCFSDEEIEKEVVKANKYLKELIEKNGWCIQPVAFINEFEYKEEDC